MPQQNTASESAKTSKISQSEDSQFKLTDLPANNTALQTYFAPLTEPQPLASGSNLRQGGFSGLWFDHTDSAGNSYFWTLTDRGPNGKEFTKENTEYRPFLWPGFQPQVYLVKIDPEFKSFKIERSIGLQIRNQQPLSGLPNLEERKSGQNARIGDETPVDDKKEVLALDPMGIDSEGVCIDSKKNIWVVEEYRPSILKFSPDGSLIRRYVPFASYSLHEIQKIDQDWGEDLILQVLPDKLRFHRRNRGFEGVTCLHDQKKNRDLIYAVMQSPLPNEKEVRIIEFDPIQEEVTRQFLYNLENSEVADKIGDLTYRGGIFYAIEQNGKKDANAFRRIYKFKIPDEVSPEEFSTKKSRHKKKTSTALKKEALDWPDTAPTFPIIDKKLFLDLAASGLDKTEKIEGLAFSDKDMLFLINDNDFIIDATSFISIFKQTELNIRIKK